MKLKVRVSEDIMIEEDVKSQADAFAFLARTMEVFSQTCGKCGNSKGLRFVVRDVDGCLFYECRCSCGARLSFGQHKTGGTLFPKRQTEEDGEKKWLVDSGWLKWDSKLKKNV